LSNSAHLLDRQIAVAGLADARHKLSEQPYPLDEAAADVVTAALSNAVETWDSLADTDTVTGWVIGAFMAEGHKLLPAGAGTWQSDRDGSDWPGFARPTEEELRACFADESAWEAFSAATDYTCGLADVPDAVVAERVAKVMAALQRSDVGGERGVLVRFRHVLQHGQRGRERRSHLHDPTSAGLHFWSSSKPSQWSSLPAGSDWLSCPSTNSYCSSASSTSIKDPSIAPSRLTVSSSASSRCS
jgi:hypothetical protein